MDHLAYPTKPCRPYPRFPCLCLDDSSRQGLGIFEAEYYGLDQSLFLDGTPPHPRDCGGFLQAWLWFGTLRTVFGIAGLTFRLDDFLCTETEDEITPVHLSTKHLHLYFWQWVAAQNELEENDRHAQLQLLDDCIRGVYTVLRRYTVSDAPYVASNLKTHEHDEYMADDEDTHVLLAITILAEAIDAARFDVYRGYEFQSFSWQESLIVRQWLLDAGWCPNELVWLVDSFTTSHVQTLLYLSTIDRAVLGKDHSECSAAHCHYIKIDYDTYRADHADEGCECSDISLSAQDRGDMYDMIRRGEAPLIFAQETSDGTKCMLHKSETPMSRPIFVAISHVWSDRLGNLRQNALPACQIKRIQGYVNDLYPNLEIAVPFWIDTICIPRDFELRRLAINSMRTVYETAHKVLVLDKSLTNVASASPPEELLVRIKVATWSQRLWTFHESGLAVRLHFQFKDGSLNGDELERRYYEIPGDGPSALHVQQIVDSTHNGMLSKALCRALALSDDGTSFHDLAGYDDPTQDITLEDPLAKFHREEGDDTELDPLEQTSPASSLSTSSSEIDWTDPEIANDPNLAAIKARIDAIESETVRTRAMTAMTREELDEVRQNIEDLDARMHRMTNFLHGYSLQRRPDPPPTIPSEWLIEPSKADLALRTMLRMLATTPVIFRFWLKGFDPIFSEGVVEFPNLRTAHKQLLDEVPVRPNCRQVAEALHAIRWRRTSWIEDEPICLGIILGVNVHDLQKDENVNVDMSPTERSQYLLEHRMMRLTTYIDEVPRDIIFSSVPRLGNQGYSWMPKSFLAQGLLIHFGNTPVATRSDNGLCFEATGFTFILPPSLDDSATMNVRLSDDVQYVVTLKEGWESRGWNTLGTQGPVDIILRSAVSIYRSSTGVIATPSAFEGKVRHVRYAGTVIVVMDQVSHADTSGVCNGDVMASTQRWCLA